MSAFADETGRDSASPFIVWGKALLDDPQATLSDILSGRGARGAQQRAEPEDFLADLLAHPTWQDQRAQLTEGLDTALLNWLKARIEWSPARINRFGTRAYAARISDALAVAARLPLKVTAQDLIRHQSAWDNRFRGLRWPGDIDLLQQFDLVLAQHQADTRFASRWFAACDEAAWGSPYWQTNLSTGLLGLRKLPGTADTEPERRVAAALARFGALALKRGMNSLDVQTAFRRRAAALTLLYPRHDGHWQDVWDRVLGGLSQRNQKEASTIRTDWLDHVSAPGSADGGQSRRDRKHTYGSIATRRNALPDATSREQIRRAINRAQILVEDLWEKTRDLIRAHWAYASESGECYFAVRTTHNLCDRLLRLGPAEPHLADMHVWTLRAIEAESENGRIWDLWAKVLSALGRDDASLSVRWESMRRFPDDCVLRTSLAEALLEHHRVALAESLLRETMRDFPRDEVCRNILAELLVRTEREGEAESLLRETMRDFPRDEVCRNILAELLVRTEREGEAESLLRETMRDFPRDEVCRNILAELLVRAEREGEAESLLRETMRDFPRGVVNRHILVKTLWRQGRQEEAKAEFVALEALAPNDPYVQSLSEMMTTIQAEEAQAAWTELSEYRGTEANADLRRQPAPGQAQEREIGLESIGAGPEILAYLDRLTDQIPLLEDYFAPSEGVNGSDTTLGALHLDEITSEVGLVAAHRAGLMEGSESRERLEAWASVRPSSYSARLLLAWQGREGNGMDREAMSEIKREFPKHRRWNEWLCYGFISEEERSRLRQEATDGSDETDRTFWRGRLSAVYPDLKTEDEDIEDGVSYDPAALKRLLEDVAFAGAAQALPSVSIS